MDKSDYLNDGIPLISNNHWATNGSFYRLINYEGPQFEESYLS